MPADPLTQVGELALSAATVCGVAAPLGLLGWGIARGIGRSILPPRARLRAGWNGLTIVFLFLLHTTLSSVAYVILSSSGFFQSVYGPDFPEKDNAAHHQVQLLWASFLSTPILLLVAAVIWFAVLKRPARMRAIDLPGQVALGAIGWAVITPVVFGVNFTTIAVVNLIGGNVESHPLTHLGVGGAAWEWVFFGVVVCFITPLAEEFLFRGLLVRWASGRAFRPWVLMGIAAGLSLYRGDGTLTIAPTVFVFLLTCGLFGILWVMRNSRVGVRETAGVYASAAVFAAAHSAVWPSPVPLFVLGLGLGYLALRTGGIAACVVLHGLFNAISFVFLLRGAG